MKIIHSSDWQQDHLFRTYREAVAMVHEENAGWETEA